MPRLHSNERVVSVSPPKKVSQYVIIHLLHLQCDETLKNKIAWQDRTYFLQADQVGEMDSWMKALAQAQPGKKVVGIQLQIFDFLIYIEATRRKSYR
jgi:hypothetical protein